jgi:curved DNA-binding protein
MEFKDYYQTLGLSKAASADQIKKAYRKLARKYHPDVSKEADAAQRIIEINEANAVLSDPEKRMAYDELARQPKGQREREFRPPPQWDQGFEFSDGGRGSTRNGHGSGHGQDADYSDFFEQLFGREAHAQRAGRHPSNTDEAPFALRGDDQHAGIELDLLDAYTGADRTITLQTARLDAHGQPVHEERHLQVKIPKGMHEGQHIRLLGKGSPGIGPASPGDLFLAVHFRADPRWHAKGRDVFQRMALSPWEAALGGHIKVHTPGGEAEVDVPAGWRAGRKLRLKGRGIPGASPGDLYLELDISLPPSDTEASRAAYATMARAFPAFNPRLQQGA